MNVLFLGYGKMGQALGESWLKQKLVTQLVAVDPQLSPNQHSYFNDIQDVPQQAFDLVVLAVKPNSAETVLKAINPALLQGTCLISIMAGVSTASLTGMLGKTTIPVVRVMPNTPVLAQAGCCVLYTASTLADSLKDKLNQLFSTVGYCNWLEQEQDLHAVTALSGSGPAYIHLFTEALQNAGIRLGLAPELARDLAKHTAYGAALLQTTSEIDFVQLRKNVTSPNGTTHAAIETFEKESALRNLVDDALQAALDRSIELSRI